MADVFLSKTGFFHYAFPSGSHCPSSPCCTPRSPSVSSPLHPLFTPLKHTYGSWTGAGRRGWLPAWGRTTVIGSVVGTWPKSGQSELIQFYVRCWGSCPVPFAIRLWSLSCCRRFIITKEKRLDNGANPGAESRGASQQEETGSQRHHWGPESTHPCGQRYLQNFQKSQQMFSRFTWFEMCLQPAESWCRNFKWKCTYK